jgi:hypothetical protein
LNRTTGAVNKNYSQGNSHRQINIKGLHPKGIRMQAGGSVSAPLKLAGGAQTRWIWA